MVCGLIAAVVLARGSVVKAIGMVVLGLAARHSPAPTSIPASAASTSAFQGLADGIEFVALSMAIYGIGEVAYNLEARRATKRDVTGAHRQRLAEPGPISAPAFPAILRGTVLGSLLGVLPGGGALLAAFGAYTLEKKVAKPPRNFGDGDIRGVAAPESANNAGAQTSFIPMLTLGIPSNPTMAMMIGALMIHGISPGPRVMTERPELFWGVIASMWIGNLMLVVLNLPLVGMWVTLPAHSLSPAVSGDHRLLLHRRLHDQQQRLRRVRDGVLRRVRLPLPQARLRAGAADPRLRAGPDDGGESAPHAADLARRSDCVPERADQPGVPGRFGAACCWSWPRRGSGSNARRRCRNDDASRKNAAFERVKPAFLRN